MFHKYRVGIALMLSGASALIYEICVTQILFFYFVESSYSLAIVLSTFLTGLGIGSYTIYRLIKPSTQKGRFFGISQIFLSLYAWSILTHLPIIIPKISPLGILFVSFFILLPPAVVLGAMFPLASALMKTGNNDTSGLVYALDLVGAVLGSIAVGFYLIPTYGIVFAIIVGSVLNILAAAVMLPHFYKLIPIGIALVFLVFNKFNLIQSFAPTAFHFYRNSPFGAVSVVNKTLYLNGKEQCSLLYPESASERKIVDYALVPFAGVSDTLHVLNIGLGCGLTVSKVLGYDNTQLDVAEINPVVVEANKRFTHTFEGRAFRLFIGDGFEFMRHSADTYHAIVLDVEDPKVLHSSPLYTTESFALVKNRLAHDGIFAFWTYEPPQWKSPKSIRRYLDILYYSLKKSFEHVYWYPRVFVATDREIGDGQEYAPQSEYEINTLDRNTISSVFDWF